MAHGPLVFFRDSQHNKYKKLFYEIGILVMNEINVLCEKSVVSMFVIVPLQSLSTQQLVYLAIQIVKAIQFLHRKKILHKDIATRNCV